MREGERKNKIKGATTFQISAGDEEKNEVKICFEKGTKKL